MGGCMPLALIKNSKTVNPTDPTSQKVYQLETAMGAAIDSFTQPQAVVVPRSRFAPVKTCADLLSLRSDAYVKTAESTLQLDPSLAGKPPVVSLKPDSEYKMLGDFEKLIQDGVPSLKECTSLKLDGMFKFADGVVIKGDATFSNKTTEVQTIDA